ncbi:hypothetical protein [Pseudooceanicola nitratireducens]|uniref:hypothetical protein n=1 Tax=Pseudooceanicola nitratireducens TaxID=517719 RepID=UPI0035137FD6
MAELILPLVLSLAVTGAGIFFRYKGARYLLIGMGALTAVGLIAVIALQALALGLGCTGTSLRAMSCPEGGLTGAVTVLGGFASLLTLPGLVAGPVAVPLAALAEYWTRRNRA